MLTQERADKLAAFLNSDEQRATALANLEPEQAVEELKKHGQDFTADELKAFAEIAKSPEVDDELDSAQLDRVSGGCKITATVVAVAVSVGW